MEEKLRNAISKGERVVEVVNSQGWSQDIKPALERRLKTYEQALLSGKLPHDEYLRTAGMIQELQALVDLPDLLVRSASNAARALHD